MIGRNVVLPEHVFLSLYAKMIVELPTQLLLATYFMLSDLLMLSQRLIHGVFFFLHAKWMMSLVQYFLYLERGPHTVVL